MNLEPVEVKKINLNKFCLEVEEVINDLVEESKAMDWDEDYLTRKLLGRLTSRLNGSQISDLDNKIVFLTPFKLGKELEKKFGDIAIVVAIEYGDDDRIEGMAFLEAKKRYKKSGDFDAIKWEQLERVFNGAPHSQLLLYDFRDVSEFASTGLVPKRTATLGSPMMQLPVTKFVVLPINKAIQIKQKNDRMYKLSLPFSYQLAYRYMNGFDLDFTKNILDAVKSDFAKNHEVIDLEVPEYLIYISIVTDKNPELSKGKEKKRTMKIPETGINENLYLRIKPNAE